MRRMSMSESYMIRMFADDDDRYAASLSDTQLQAIRLACARNLARAMVELPRIAV